MAEQIVDCKHTFYTGLGIIAEVQKARAFAYVCPHCSDTHLAICTGEDDFSVLTTMTPEAAEQLGASLINPSTFEGLKL